MSKEEFFDKVMKLWADKSINADEFCYEFGKVVKEYEAAQQSVQSDGALCEDCWQNPVMEGCSVCAECGL